MMSWCCLGSRWVPAGDIRRGRRHCVGHQATYRGDTCGREGLLLLVSLCHWGEGRGNGASLLWLLLAGLAARPRPGCGAGEG